MEPSKFDKVAKSFHHKRILIIPFQHSTSTSGLQSSSSNVPDFSLKSSDHGTLSPVTQCEGESEGHTINFEALLNWLMPVLYIGASGGGGG